MPMYGRVCIGCCIKQNVIFLQRIVENMVKIGYLFNDFQIIFFYDESTDGTLGAVKNLTSTYDNVTIIENLTPLTQKAPRTHKIAYARNGILDVIRDSYADYEYFIMMDGDEVCCGDVNLDVLENALKRDDWDGISFSKEHYYDLWAIGMTDIPYSCWNFDHPRGLYTYSHEICVALDTCKKGELLPVYSAFCGFGLYRTNKFIDSKYDGSPRMDLIPTRLLKANVKRCGPIKKTHQGAEQQEQDEDMAIAYDCEHRAFHLYAVFVNTARMRIMNDILFPTDTELEEHAMNCGYM